MPNQNTQELSEVWNPLLSLVFTSFNTKRNWIKLLTKSNSIHNISQVLRNRLKEYNTIRQNMYPEEVGCETQRTLELTKQLSEELKKQ